MAARWQDDEAFVCWLLAMGYASQTEKGLRPYLSAGAVIYMFEAYLYGKKCCAAQPLEVTL